MPIVVDLITVFLIAMMTYALMSEGLWGAALMFFNALFSTMITLNFYEPLAQLIATNVSFLSGFADTMCILVIFTVSLLIIRLITEALAPSMVRFPTPVYHIGRILFSLGASLLTAGVLLLGLDAAPVHKRALGAYDYKYKPFFGSRLDKEILALFQYSTGQIFTRQGDKRDPFDQYGHAHVFDPKGRWLLNAQEARPYGKGKVIEDEAPAEPAVPAAPAAPAPAAPPG